MLEFWAAKWNTVWSAWLDVYIFEGSTQRGSARPGDPSPSQSAKRSICWDSHNRKLGLFCCISGEVRILILFIFLPLHNTISWGNIHWPKTRVIYETMYWVCSKSYTFGHRFFPLPFCTHWRPVLSTRQFTFGPDTQDPRHSSTSLTVQLVIRSTCRRKIQLVTPTLALRFGQRRLVTGRIIFASVHF